jgi:competence protein ComEC
MKNIIPNISLSIQLGILAGALIGSFFVMQSPWIIGTIPLVILVYWFYQDIRLLKLIIILIFMIVFGFYVNNKINIYFEIQANIPTKFTNTEIIIKSVSKVQKFGYQYEVYIPKYNAKAFMNIENSKLKYGEMLSIKGKSSIPKEEGIKRFLLGQNIHIFIQSSDYQIINNQCNYRCHFIRLVYEIRFNIVNKIDKAYPNQVGEFLKGILIGYTDTLPDEIKESFKKTGVSHILAVSGYNMAIIIMLVYQQLINRQISRRISFWVTIIIMIIFTILTGAEASIMRAGIFAILILTAEQIQRYVGGIRPLILCATILIITNPFYIAYDIGFQLSFLAVIGLIIYGQIFKMYTEGIPSLGILPMIGETFFAQILVLPILIYYFGQISIISILANMLIVPVIPLAMAWGGLTSLLLPWSIFTYPLIIIIQIVLSLNQILSSLSWSSINIPKISGFMVLLIYVFFGLLYYLYKNKIYNKYES